MAETTSTRGFTTGRAPRVHASGADAGWAVTGTLISGMAVWGGAGWLLDQWLDTRWFFALGVLLGVSVAIYLVVLKYGNDGAPGSPGTADSPTGRRSRTGMQKGRR